MRFLHSERVSSGLFTTPLSHAAEWHPGCVQKPEVNELSMVQPANIYT